MKDLIIVRGGGDLATATINRLYNVGYKVAVLETKNPAAIRRQVSLCEAVYQKEHTVENVTAVLVDDITQLNIALENHKVPILIDPFAKSLEELKPEILIDAIIAKKNLGTTKDMANLTIALGPGFVAGQDVDVVIETKRGHNLGRIIYEGMAQKNTGIPGDIMGYKEERVIHASADGVLKPVKKIKDIVKKGEIIAYIVDGEKKVAVLATIDGIIRGLIREEYQVYKGLKIADIDPRITELENCSSISDKARCIAGSVLEVVCKHFNDRGKYE